MGMVPAEEIPVPSEEVSEENEEVSAENEELNKTEENAGYILLGGIVYAYLNVDQVIEYRDGKNSNKNITLNEIIKMSDKNMYENKIVSKKQSS